ncbi:MAG: choice-of-anchor tandem repeat GloVer-containing protein, partial [Chthoniobacteraceae bacterium]
MTPALGHPLLSAARPARLAVDYAEAVSPAALLGGNNPKAQLIVGADGAFYGTTQFGGSSNQGTVFKVTAAGVMTPLANFYGANGAQPWSGLVLASDGNFYGTTSAGGINNLGTIFKMTPAGVLTTLVHLSTTTGTVPKAPLTQGLDGNFYGTASSGGGSGSGAVFKVTSSGVLTVMVNFTGTTGSFLGSSCQAGLIQATDTNFYGVTSTGGNGGGFGTIFKLTTGGTFTSLASFTGTTGATLGSAPLAALVQASDGILYGTTSVGGTGGFGTVFKVTTAAAFTNLLSFTNTAGSFLGNSPQGALVQWATDGNLYGTTNTGGTNSVGTIFKVTTAGALTTLRSMASTADGSNPYGALVLASDGNFYGAATNGGASSRGDVFSISPATNSFTRVFSFVISPPVYKRLLLANDGNFYGVTQFGSNNSNTIFKLTPAGTLSTLVTLGTGNTTAPFIIQGSDGKLYGAVPSESGFGTVFSVTLAGVRTTLATFTNTAGAVLGNGPAGGIMQGTDGLIYGVTSSGGSGGGFGTAWKITTGGSFTSLGSFTGTTGAVLGTSPQTRMVQGNDSNFYGTTQNGGAGGFGTVFKAAPAGGITSLTAFTGTTGAVLGSSPNTNLVLASDGNFYGTTTGGGTGGFGTIFKIASDGTFTSLLSFTNTSGANLGATPSTNLIQGSDGNLYGTTTGGGTIGSGTVFKMTPAGVLTNLVSFTGTTGVAPGATPNGTLVQGSDGYFYGTTNAGGIYNLGTVFRVSASGIFQSLYTIGSSNDGGSPNISGSSLYPDSYRLITSPDGYLYGVNTSSVFRVHQQPAVQLIAATNLTPTGATLSGSVIPNQDDSTAYYQYGLNTTYGSQTTAQNLSAGTAAVPVNASLTGLLPGVIYHFRLVTVTPQGTFFTADQTFATPSAPQVITGSFVNAAQIGFALDGVVNPLGTSTDYYFEYGLDITYGTQTTTKNAGSGIANVPVSLAVNLLVPDTTYHVRLVATNSFGTNYGDDQVIRTFPQVVNTVLTEEEEENKDPDEVISPAAIAASTVQPISQYLNTGTAPLAGLFKGTDGNFYGAMSTGGTFGSAGTVYRMSQGGTLTTLANLYSNTNGGNGPSSPQASLVQGADGNFYGTATGGGTGNGTIFKMTPAGVVTTLVSFSSNSGSYLGSNPVCGLTVGLDGNFYGATNFGGSPNLGTIFKVTPAGVFTTLVSFTGTTGSFLGSSPRAALTLGNDGNFYGTTATGGASGFGTIFKVTPAGVLTTLVQFSGTTGSYLGSTPIGALVQGTDGSLYGTTSLGGVNNLGTAFKVTTTATFTSLTSFSGTTGSALGSTPKGALAQMPDGNFYGTTQTGGLNNFGTVFSITSAGVLTTLVNFTGSTGAALGATPQGALIAGTDGALYGTTNSGGLNNVGSVFKVTTGGLFTTLVNVTAAPNFGRLTQGEAGNIYGSLLSGGGANGYGSLFAAPITGAPDTLSTLVPVSGVTALNARAGMLRGLDGNYYGTTAAGGAINSGSVFMLTPVGVYSTLISFTGTSGTNPGSGPQAALITGSDNNYYGTTSGGGSSSLGTIFKMTPAGVQSTLINFTGTTGANLGSSPQGSLTLGSDGNYYGTTVAGGSGGGFGTVFKMTQAGVLTTLVNFTGTTGAALGQSPLGVLAQGDDGNFYGVTSSGGAGNLGSVFKVTPAGVFTSLASFTGTTGTLPGQTPTGGLFAGRDGSLYGVTAAGGVYFAGTIFRVALDGSVASIYTFTGRTDGLTPNNGVVLASDDFLYGGDATAMYRLNPPPVALIAAATDITASTATLHGSITGNNYAGEVSFDYGLTTGYGTTTTPQPFVSGFSAASLDVPITGLQPFLTYHVRIGVETPVGEFNSRDITFSTPNIATFNAGTDVPVSADGFNASGLPLNITLGFAPANGTVLMLVQNTGFTPVVGTFNGLPNGSVVSATFGAQTYFFVINYAGGDGNDITLTAVSQAITFAALPAKQTTDAPFALSATATSGLPVSYSIVAGGASATLAGNTVTLTGTAGVVTITASQPGNGTTIGPALPVTQSFAVFSGGAFTQISSSKTNSGGFTLGIRTGGTLWGWGNNGNGQLGNGTTTSSTTPVQIGAVTNWKSVSSGASFALAVRLDGTLWAWGLNSSGQVGDGTITQRTSPVQIGAATNWAAVTAGNAHAIALKTDGTLWAWGSNVNGELGQGTSDALTTHTSPVQVGIVTTWSGISAGNNHVLATRTDGTLWAWGLNSSGQVG